MKATLDCPRRHAFTVEEYVRMVEAYVFGPHARLELMEGELLEMAPIRRAHASVVRTLDTLIRQAVPGAIVSVQNLLVLGERSALQPDVVLVRPCADRYCNSHPIAVDSLLVVEVADTALTHDFGIRHLLYARAGVAELWMVDIKRRELHVFREPELDYSINRVLSGSEIAAVAALGDVAFPVSALFADL